MPVFAAVDRFAESQPQQIALDLDGETLSYGELWQRVQQCHLALSYLPKNGPRRFNIPENGALVVLALPNHVRFAEIFVAASASPHCVAVLSTLTPDRQIEEILARLQPDIVFTDEATSHIAAIAKKHGLSTLSVHENTKAPHSYDEWLSASRDMPAMCFSDMPDRPFFIGFTSGTTGLPKAFIRTRASWRKSLEGGRQVFGLKAGENTLAPGPMAHGVTLYALAEALDSGGALFSMTEFNAQTVMSVLPHMDRFVGVPTMLTALAKRSEKKPDIFPRLRQLVTGAAKLERAHLTAAKTLFPNAAILQYYGASELSFVAVNKMSDVAVEQSDFMSEVGKPFVGVNVTIRNEKGETVPYETIGTIYVESDLVATGYLWGDNGQSFKITPDGATVGDMGMMDKKGNVYVLGRAGNMIISAGNNIYLAEIEEILKKIEGISDAIAFGQNDDYYGQRLIAVVSFCKEMQPRIEDIITACLQSLPKYKIPKEIYIIQHWPMTWSGKISREKVMTMVRQENSEVKRL